MIYPVPGSAAPAESTYLAPKRTASYWHSRHRGARRIFYLLSAKLICVGIFLLVAAFTNVQPAAAIVGGTDAGLSQRHWVVGVALSSVVDGYYAQFCGGALVAPTWVITAAHCTFDENEQPYSAAELHVLVNRLQLSSHEGQRVAVARIVRHSDFNMAELNNDLALLELEREVAAPTIALGDLANIDAQNATVYGWGVTEDGVAVDWLRQAELPLVSHLACSVIYKTYGVSISNRMLCAGSILGGVDACTGDSGGPLVAYDHEQSEWKLVGVVSWGAGCGASGAYGVYTRVSAYVDWIAEHSGIVSVE